MGGEKAQPKVSYIRSCCSTDNTDQPEFTRVLALVAQGPSNRTHLFRNMFNTLCGPTTTIGSTKRNPNHQASCKGSVPGPPPSHLVSVVCGVCLVHKVVERCCCCSLLCCLKSKTKRLIQPALTNFREPAFAWCVFLRSHCFWSGLTLG